MSDTEVKKTATERLEDLEKRAAELERLQGHIIQALQPVQSLAQTSEALKESVTLLNKKLNATIQALNKNTSANVTDDQINDLMIENNVGELSGKVSKMVSDGLLVPSDSVESSSFVVVSESNPQGKIVNPRMQFLLSSIPSEDIRNKLSGAKVGDIITVGEGGETVKVLESYSVSLPKSEEAPAEAASEASAEQSLEVSSEAQSADNSPAATEQQPSA